MKQVGYRPFHATKRLNNGEDDESDLEELEETLRMFILEHIRGVYYLGMRRSSLSDLQRGCPNLLDYITKNYANHVKGCIVARRRANDLTPPTFYVLLPDEKMTVLSWDSARRCPVHHGSEDLARSLERFKSVG